jgi:hypothetical protein
MSIRANFYNIFSTESPYWDRRQIGLVDMVHAQLPEEALQRYLTKRGRKLKDRHGKMGATVHDFTYSQDMELLEEKIEKRGINTLYDATIDGFYYNATTLILAANVVDTGGDGTETYDIFTKKEG